MPIPNSLDPREIYRHAIEANRRRRLLSQGLPGPEIPMQPQAPTNTFVSPVSVPSFLPPPPAIQALPVPAQEPTPNLMPPEPPPPTTNQAIQQAQQPPPKSSGPGFFAKVGQGLKSGIGKAFQRLSMGDKNYQEMLQYKAMLPYQQAEYDRRMALTQATPEHEVSRIKADATKRFMAGTASEQDKLLLGVVPKEATIASKLDDARQRIDKTSYIEKTMAGRVLGRKAYPGQEADYNQAVNDYNALAKQGGVSNVSGQTSTSFPIATQGQSTSISQQEIVLRNQLKGDPSNTPEEIEMAITTLKQQGKLK